MRKRAGFTFETGFFVVVSVNVGEQAVEGLMEMFQIIGVILLPVMCVFQNNRFSFCVRLSLSVSLSVCLSLCVPLSVSVCLSLSLSLAHCSLPPLRVSLCVLLVSMLFPQE